MKTKIKDVFKKCFCCLKQHIFNILLLIFAVFFGICLLLCCADRRKTSTTVRAEAVSNGFAIDLPVLTSSFKSTSSSSSSPYYVYSYATAYSVRLSFLTSPSGLKHVYFTTTGGDGSVFSPNFRIVESQTIYSYYSVYANTSPYINSTLYYADSIYSSAFSTARPLSLTFSVVDISAVSARFPNISVKNFNSPYDLTTLSFYRVIVRGDYGDTDTRSWFVEVFAPIQIEDYALFNSSSSLFVDLSNSSQNLYEQGYNAGLKASSQERYQQGYDAGNAAGYERGYSVGIEQQLSNISPLRVIFNSISDILSFEIIPNVRLGYLLTLVIGISLISLVLRGR